jgi:hypothetical protein
MKSKGSILDLTKGLQSMSIKSKTTKKTKPLSPSIKVSNVDKFLEEFIQSGKDLKEYNDIMTNLQKSIGSKYKISKKSQ